MKTLKFHLAVGLFAVTTFFSCNNSDDILNNVEQVKITQEDNLIERNILNLSTTDASKLAKQFSLNESENGSRNASNVGIKDIQTISSKSGEPLMYVVNYVDNKGFTVISATKNYTPVLAYSDEGYLNVNDASFTDNIFMDEYKTFIESVVNLESDSLRQRYAIDWSFYEKKPEVIDSRAYTDAQIQQELANARTYYSNQGYEVHSLNAATSLIPAAGGQSAEDRANGFIRDICDHTPQQYDCMDVSLLLVKRTNEQFGPYISTAWHQHAPYCTNAPYGIAGCATIAVMQLMYYHKWPAKDSENKVIDWNNISNYWTSSYITQAENDFATNVRNYLNPTYRSDGTIFSSNSVENTLKNKYKYSVSTTSYNHNTAESYMRNGKPMIMYGVNTSNSQLCHYWICDGYKSNRVQYAAYIIDRDFGEYTFFSGMTDIMNEYFHLNMGTGSNAWFYQDNAVYNNASYTANRKMYIITPNK